LQRKLNKSPKDWVGFEELTDQQKIMQKEINFAKRNGKPANEP
jgi:hypothetical protein